METIILTPTELPHAWTLAKFLLGIALLGVLAAVFER
jgi:hypothetical protein